MTQFAPISNADRKLLRKLNQTKQRKKLGLFMVEGARAVAQVLENGQLRVERLFLEEGSDLLAETQWQEVAETHRARSIPADELRGLSDTDQPQGVLAICETPQPVDPAELGTENGLLIAFDAIRDPGNMGTMIRTASWFGVAGALVGHGTVDLFHPKVVRSTAGATGTIPRAEGELHSLIAEAAQGRAIYRLEDRPGAVTLSQIPTDRNAVLVVGNEAHGIRNLPEAVPAQSVAIPKIGEPPVESLNAAVALAIALHHFA